MHVFIRKPYARFHMCTCSKLCYIRFCINLCVLLLSMTLFVCHFVPPYEVSESIVSVTYDSSFIHMSSSKQLDISSSPRNMIVTR